MTDVWLISGIPGAGKTTTARLVAEGFDRSVVIEGDYLIVSRADLAEYRRQLEGLAVHFV